MHEPISNPHKARGLDTIPDLAVASRILAYFGEGPVDDGA